MISTNGKKSQHLQLRIISIKNLNILFNACFVNFLSLPVSLPVCQHPTASCLMLLNNFLLIQLLHINNIPISFLSFIFIINYYNLFHTPILCFIVVLNIIILTFIVTMSDVLLLLCFLLVFYCLLSVLVFYLESFFLCFWLFLFCHSAWNLYSLYFLFFWLQSVKLIHRYWQQLSFSQIIPYTIITNLLAPPLPTPT